MKRGHNNKNSIVVDTDDRAYCRPDRDVEPNRDFNREAERVPLSKQKLLDFAPRPGYTRYLATEYYGEIEKMMIAGWTPVMNTSNNNSDDIMDPSQMGSVVRIVVNQDPNAPAKTAILMEIPTELYEADMMAQQKEIDEQEEGFNPEKYRQEGFDYGKMQKLRKKTPY